MGIGAGFGADLLLRPSTEKTTTETTTETTIKTQTTTKTATSTATATTTVLQKPETLSYVPPLSPEVQAKVDSITQSLIARRADDTVVRGAGFNYWGGDQYAGMMRFHVKNGVITGIEGDDSVNAGVAREDDNMDNVKKGWIQLRGGGAFAAVTYAYRRYLYRPERLLYPVKRVGARGDPNAQWVRITWDEALSTIATKMQETVNKYGPYSILAYHGSAQTWNIPAYIGGGIVGWSIPSFESWTFAAQYAFGGTPPDTELPSLFNSKLIVVWSSQPNSTERYGGGYYIKLAQEKYGIPVIVVDPRFTKDANLADQWIPIRPGTDAAMLLAIANVLIKEDLYDKDFISNYVEPTGFGQWKAYVLGQAPGSDGSVIDRTPEWQESITGVPADTVRGLARLMASSKPTWLTFALAMGHEVLGENPDRCAIYVEALLGYMGKPGTAPLTNQGGTLRYTAGPQTLGKSTFTPGMFGNVAPKFKIPTLFNNYRWADVILLRPKVDSGELTEKQYDNIIGNVPGNPVPNVHFMWFSDNELNETNDINKQMEAIKQLDMMACAMWHFDQTVTRAADIVLPRAEAFEDEPTFRADGSTMGVVFAPRVVMPLGESKSLVWINLKLAEKLGAVDQYAPQLKGVTDDQYYAAIDAWVQKQYEAWVAKPSFGINAVSWDEFKKMPFYRTTIDNPIIQLADFIAGQTKLGTPSGKIEFYSNYLAKTDLTTTKYGGPINPFGEYVDIPEGFFDQKTNQYPLMLISPHARYRYHSWGDGNPMLRTDVYRHSVWLSVADAKARGIMDGDKVRVFNDIGEMVIPAYVTSKIVPGVVSIYEGAWANFNKAGLDMRGSPNTVIPQTPNPAGQWPFHALVQVEKF